MVQSMDVSARPSFTQIAQQFDGISSNTHLRLKDGQDGGRTLYAHTSKFSLTGHGMLTKQSEIMTRRNEATQMVVDAFKREFKDYGPLVNKVLSHVMSDDSFEKHTDELGQHLQLRTSDVGRLREMMLSEIETNNNLKSERDKVSPDYSATILKEAMVKAVGMEIRPGQTVPLLGGMTEREVHDGYARGLRETVAEKSALAFLDPGVTNIFTGDTHDFMTSLQEHSNVMLTRSFMEAPGLTSLKPLLGAALAISDWQKATSKGEDFSLALSLAGVPPSPPPEPGPAGTLDERRMNTFARDNWAANELRSQFFGETNPLGLHPDSLTALNNKLDEIDHKIEELQSRLSGDISPGERDIVTSQLTQASARKLIAIDGAIRECVTTLLESRQGIPDNPISDTLRSMTNHQALTHARLEHDEHNQMQAKLENA